MQVRILDDDGEVIWSHGEKSGMTFLSHRKDGTLGSIIAALGAAVELAKQQLEESAYVADFHPINESSAPC